MMSTLVQSRVFQRSDLLAGQVQTMDPAEDNQVFDFLFEYETVQLGAPAAILCPAGVCAGVALGRAEHGRPF